MIKTIEIISLSSGIIGEAFTAHELKIGVERLKAMGLKVKFSEHALKGIDYIKDHPEDRAADLIEAYADPEVDMILCAIGGDDTYRLLPYLFDHDELAKAVSTQELTITGELATEIGSLDSTAIVNDLKMMLDVTATMSDEEIAQMEEEEAARRAERIAAVRSHMEQRRQTETPDGVPLYTTEIITKTHTLSIPRVGDQITKTQQRPLRPTPTEDIPRLTATGHLQIPTAEQIAAEKQAEERMRQAQALARAAQDEAFAPARQFAEAKTIVIAAPYWDLSFPAMLKQYIEHINVLGITFEYTPEGIPKGLCKADKLYYVTTAGGNYVPDDFGFGYIKALAQNFYGIKDVKLIKASGLDIYGANTKAIMKEAVEGITL